MNYWALLTAFACYWLPFRVLWDMSMRPERYQRWNLRTYSALFGCSFLMLAGHGFVSIVNTSRF